MFPKEFSIVLLLVLFLIWIYLFFIGRIDPKWLAGFLLISLFMSVVLYNIDNIKNISASKDAGLLVEMKEIRDDIYAKSEEVKAMGEQVAEVAAFTIAGQGRFTASEDHLFRLVDSRNRLAKMLVSIGTDQEEIIRILYEPDKMICLDLWTKHSRKVDQYYHALLGKEELSSEEFDKIRETMNSLRDMFRRDQPETDLIKHLSGTNLETPIQEKIAEGIKKSYQECSYYKKNQKLMN